MGAFLTLHLIYKNKNIPLSISKSSVVPIVSFNNYCKNIMVKNVKEGGDIVFSVSNFVFMT